MPVPSAATGTTSGPSEIREVVGLFDRREAFDRAVADLLAGGFAREDLSVLASHTSLEAAEHNPPRARDDAMTALVGELNYAFPLTTAGLLAFVGGPITAAVAAVVAAGIGGIAIKDYLDELTSHPDTDDFARALEAGGVILWVRVADEAAEARAAAVLEAEGGANVHLATREA